MSSGYSGKPLVQILGFAPTDVVWALHAPADYEVLLAGGESEPSATVHRVDDPTAVAPGADRVHVFATLCADLEAALVALRHLLDPAGMVWVSWPKKAAKVATDITEDVIREIALPLGWVDIKVCAVDATWSGLKLVVRRELR